MAISKFDKQLQIEQIRYIETEHPLDCDSDPDLLEHSGRGILKTACGSVQSASFGSMIFLHCWVARREWLVMLIPSL